MWGLVGLTYGLVAFVTLLSVAAYFYYRSAIPSTSQADPDPTQRMLVGAVWVPIYEKATYVEPGSVQQNEITTGTVKFRTDDPAGAVLEFYKHSLEKTGYLTSTTGNVGGMIQGVADRGKMSVSITVTSGAKNTTGEIHTLRHVEAKGTSPAK
jgi:hypothetical protein